MTARPAPLTPDEERKLRLDLEYGFGLRADEAAPLMATLDATRAKLAEAEAQRDAAAADYTVARTDAMAAESRVAALTEALRECEEWFDGRADVDDGPDGQPVPNSAMRMQQLCAAALSPSQDAKGGA